MTLSAFLSTDIIDNYLRGGARDLALFTVMPARDGTGGSEVVGGSYARQGIVLGADVDGVTMNVNALEFTGMPDCDLVGGGVYDGGTLLALGYFASHRHVVAGVDFTVLPGDVVVVIR